MIKQVVTIIGLIFLAGCSATTTVEPSVRVLPTKDPELRAVLTEADEATEFTEVVRGETADRATEPVSGERQDKLAAELNGAVILYQKSGGIAGVVENWWIYENGRLVDNQGDEWQLPADQVAQFLAESQQLGLSRMRESYIPDGFCCDQFIYGLTVQQGNQVYQVVTADGVEGAPTALTKLINDVTQLVDAREK